MKARLGRCAVTAALIVGVAFLLFVKPSFTQQGGAGQNARQAKLAALEAKPTPRMADGHPDLSGFYGGGTEVSGLGGAEDTGTNLTKVDGNIFFDYGGANTGGQTGLEGDPANGILHPGDKPPYKPEYQAKQDKIAATVYGWSSHLDPFMECKPLGVPRSGIGGALEIIQNPKRLAILYENNPGPQYRLIYTDGRKHPSDYDSSYQGDSIGHWEGDVLVVDTIGLNDETWLGAPLAATIHSDKEHVIERYSRKGDVITLETTVEDPVMFTKPWVMPVRRATIGPSDDYIQPQTCNDTADREHIQEPTATDKFVCDFCQKDPDAFYGPGASTNKSTPGAKKATQ
jgi:hypothetical protein